MKRRKVEYPSQSEEVKEKKKITNLKNRNCENPMQDPEVRAKGIATNIKKRGVANPGQSKETQEKMKVTNLQKRGVPYSLQCEKTKEKGRNTNLRKRGVPHHMQTPESVEKVFKSAHRKKEYSLPSGKTIQYQGYEKFALDYLLYVDCINEDDIFTSMTKVPTIFWYDKNNKRHRYFVDIYIPNQNRCVEVKSTWTAREEKQEDMLTKQQAVKDAGYICEIWIFNKEGNIIDAYL